MAFVEKGDFPRSRLGEKQRGKVLATWVSRKMRTIAQFSIRDGDAEGSISGTTVVPEEGMGRRGSAQSGKAGTIGNGSLRRAGGTAGSSLRHVESVTHMTVPEEAPMLGAGLSLQTSPSNPSSLTSTAFEPMSFGSSFDGHADEREAKSDDTPTNERPRPLALNTTTDYSPIEPLHLDEQGFSGQDQWAPQPYQQYQQPPAWSPPQHGPSQGNTYLHYEPSSPIEMGGRGGGLRVANPNRDSAGSEEWPQEALRHMNIGR